jgi:hypothetical protein
MPPLPPGGQYKQVVAAAFTLGCTIEAFDATAQLSFCASLAAQMPGVDPADVFIVSVTAGSVVVQTEIRALTLNAAVAAATYIEATPAATLSSDLGISVTAVSTPIVAMQSFTAPSPPPPSPPPIPPPPTPPPPTPPPPTPPPPSPPPPSLPPTPESFALTSLFDSAGGKQWNLLKCKGATSMTWDLLGDPCLDAWACVQCDADAKVTGLLLQGVGLTGKLCSLQAQALCRLTPMPTYS